MRILWLKTELLHPIDKGGKIRTYQMLRRIRQAHDVTYITLVRADDPAEALTGTAEYCRRLIPIQHQEVTKFSARFYRDLAFNLSSPLPYAIQKYRSAAMQEAIRHELQRRGFDTGGCGLLSPSGYF